MSLINKENGKCLVEGDSKDRIGAYGSIQSTKVLMSNILDILEVNEVLDL